LHANAIAAELDIPKVIIPLSPGVSSALGLLVADIKHHFSRTYVRQIRQADLAFVETSFLDFERQGRDLLDREGIPEPRQSFYREVDLRYSGQSFELKIPVPGGSLGPNLAPALEDAFHKAHEQAYGHSTPGEPVEIVNLRSVAEGAIPKPRFKRLTPTSANGQTVRKIARDVSFHGDSFVSTPIYDRYKLPEGATVRGPAIIEEFDSTVLIQPGYQGSVDEVGSIHIRKEGV
jgi:N-methylhydantoinase A